MSTHSSCEPVICFGVTNDELTTHIMDPVSHRTMVAMLFNWSLQQGVIYSCQSFNISCHYTCHHWQHAFTSQLNLFVLCISPLSILISSLSLNHHFYPDDIQRFSHSKLVTESSIVHFQTTLKQINSWMSENLLTVPFETFLRHSSHV